MTDQHPLTDDIINTFASPQYDYFEGIGEINLGYDYDDLRAGADWQLKQVIEWLKEHAGEYAYEDYYGPCFNDNGLLDDLEEAMRPTTTQEEN